MLKRERGYAVPNDPGNIFYRMAFHPDLKQRIARTAADCVSDGETVMIETGSTCILFAEELARTRKNVTIVTNSVCLAEYVRNIQCPADPAGRYPAEPEPVPGRTSDQSGCRRLSCR